MYYLLKRIDENWSLGACTIFNAHIIPPTANNPPSLINGLMFSGMNSKTLAGGFRDDNHPEHHMQLWNRWTLETDSVRFAF